MKQLFLILALALSLCAYSQEDKTVTLVVSGQGKTQDEAKQNALRSAIEQAFGTFISSKTEILNDNLVKDEVVSVANGNIQKFEILSEVQMQNGEWSNTLKAVVSISKLISFCENKGISVEFKGSLFAYNVNQQIMNEKNEIQAIEDVCRVIKNIADVSFDYTITASDPISVDASNSEWRIPMYISVYKNSNFENIPKILFSALKGISLSLEEAKNYIQLGKNVYPISIASNENDYSYILLRKDASISRLLEMLYYFNHSLQNFKISNGIAEWSIKDNPENIKYIYDYGFRIFIKENCKASVFYKQFKCYWGQNKVPVKVVRNRSNTEFDPEYNAVLNYKDWSTYNRISDGRARFWNDAVNAADTAYFSNIKDFQTLLNPYTDLLFLNQFAFVKNLENKILNNVPGLVISFIPYYYDSSNKKKKDINVDKELVRFYYEDIRNIDEINKISEYKVLPVKN